MCASVVVAHRTALELVDSRVFEIAGFHINGLDLLATIPYLPLALQQ